MKKNGEWKRERQGRENEAQMAKVNVESKRSANLN